MNSQCESDADCASGHVCTSQQCVTPPPPCSANGAIVSRLKGKNDFLFGFNFLTILQASKLHTNTRTQCPYSRTVQVFACRRAPLRGFVCSLLNCGSISLFAKKNPYQNSRKKTLDTGQKWHNMYSL